MTTPFQGSGSAAEEVAESLGEPAVDENQKETPSYEHGRTDTHRFTAAAVAVRVLRAQNQARQYHNTEEEGAQKPPSIAEEL